MKQKNILITGGCGFIGANLIRFLLKKTEWNITILDNLSTGKKEHLNGLNKERIKLIKGDIRNKKDVEKAIQNCDLVVNLAAQVGVIPSIEKPFFDMDVNVKGLLNLLQTSIDNNIERFVHASSAAPLGEQEMPLDETKVPAPLSPYGASKLAGEGYCSAFSGSYNLKTAVLRFSNVYGPFSMKKNSVVALFIRKILNHEKLTIYGDGEQTRDFVHAKDIAQGIYLALSQDLPTDYNLIQLGTGVETSVNKLVEMLNQEFNNKNPVEYAPLRKGEIIRNYTNISKAQKTLGYKPEISLKQGLNETATWFKKK